MRRAAHGEIVNDLAQNLAGIRAGNIRQHTRAEIGLDAAQCRKHGLVEGGERGLLARVLLDEFARLFRIERDEPPSQAETFRRLRAVKRIGERSNA
jgi:hypothetical protein